MDLDELNDFADWEEKRREKLFGKNNEEMILIDLAKLSEEVGEFSNEVQNILGLQRKEKLKPVDLAKKDAGEEFADVIFVAAMLAKRLGIDIQDAIDAKADKVRSRRYE